MGTLSYQVRRLCNEIVALRESRHVLMADLGNQTQAMKDAVENMRKGFQAAHTEMAKRTGKERANFVSQMKTNVTGMLNGFNLAHAEMAATTGKARADFVRGVKGDVAGMLSGFHGSRATMAKKSKDDRKAFVRDLEKTVGALRKEVSSDLAGARKAWMSLSAGRSERAMAAERIAKEEAERKAKAEAERKAKVEAEQKAKQETKPPTKVPMPAKDEVKTGVHASEGKNG